MLEEMYQHHVESARMHPVLVQLDAALGDMCAAANDSLHPYLARSLLQATTMSMQRILLDGGPYRCVLAAKLGGSFFGWCISEVLSLACTHLMPRCSCEARCLWQNAVLLLELLL